MKRIHLFEVEDLGWFPNWMRQSMTRCINVIHGFLKTDEKVSKIISDTLEKSPQNQIIDLCSGSGGPMIDVTQKLRAQEKNVTLTMTDLYPNLDFAKAINAKDDGIHFETEPVDATKVGPERKGLRTMICSFHHMPPKQAKAILQSAADDKQPIVIYEISDNSIPNFFWWLPLPINFLMCLFITPMVKPLTWYQIVFTYLIPIIPMAYAWDGAVSNVRTYTHDDLDELLKDIDYKDYVWEKGVVEEQMKKIYLVGYPK